MGKLSQRLLYVYTQWRISLSSFAGLSVGAIVGIVIAIIVVVGLVIAGGVGSGFLVWHLKRKKKNDE